MVIDYTVNLGNVIQLALLIGGGVLLLNTLRGDVRHIKTEMKGIQDEVKKIGDVMITQADQNRRILHLEEDLREMRQFAHKLGA